MKPGVSTESRQRVLELRRRHSLREVAERSNLPLCAVKLGKVLMLSAT
jgi:hypothetical protein